MTVANAPLGDSSTATVKRCERWEDIGGQTWRAYWSASDAGATDNADGVSPGVGVHVVEAPWMVHIDQVIGSRSVGVAVASGGEVLYEHADTVAHVPASNEKLLLSMALLDRMSPDAALPTTAEAASLNAKGVIRGGLWLVGRGDPTVTSQRMAQLADALVNAGLTRITGSVRGSTGYFSHDWFAPGWKPEFPAEEIALPSALTYMGNTVRGRHVSHPEQVAAAALTKMLRARGVTVLGDAKSGVPPAGLQPIARMSSKPLRQILHAQNVDSVNFDAEVLGKLLGVLASGQPGTIAKGAAAMHAWAAAHGATTINKDASGLSYSNRVTALGMLKLLQAADAAPWGAVLRATLPTAGEGTLEHRLQGISVQAKTGTLDNISALSGWVDLSATGDPAEFSILSSGYSESNAKDVEDAIVATLAHYAH
jgi:D-alanyl-D-alanine carboxypeptidase/D-alanyl-D-alanine-endopeptidase (penicillin-binding protein 4)